MSEWWTYTLSDFLLFSPRTFYRLIERYNSAVWPAHALTLGLAASIAWLLRRPGPRQGRIVSAILAVLWVWVGWAFLWERYATINWVASWLAGAFAVEAALLIWIGMAGDGASFRLRRDAAGTVGLILFGLASLFYPLLAPSLGRGWSRAEVFGIAPDPTAVGTLGLLLLAHGSGRGLAMTVPLLWCLVSGATLWAMGSPEAWIVGPAAALVVGAFALARTADDPPTAPEPHGGRGRQGSSRSG